METNNHFTKLIDYINNSIEQVNYANVYNYVIDNLNELLEQKIIEQIKNHLTTNHLTTNHDKIIKKTDQPIFQETNQPIFQETNQTIFQDIVQQIEFILSVFTDNEICLNYLACQAVKYNYINIVKYCYEEYGFLDSDVINNALLYGQLDILIFLVTNSDGHMLNKETACWKSTISGNVKCLEYVHSLNCLMELETILYSIKYNKKECFDYALNVIGSDNASFSNLIYKENINEIIETIINYTNTDTNTFFFDEIFKLISKLDKSNEPNEVETELNKINYLNALINISIKHENTNYLNYGLNLLNNLLINIPDMHKFVELNYNYIVLDIKKNMKCFNILHNFIESNLLKKDLFILFNDPCLFEAFVKKNDINLVKFAYANNYAFNEQSTIQAASNCNLQILEFLINNKCPINSSAISIIIESDHNTSIKYNTIKYILSLDMFDLKLNIKPSDENYFLAILYNEINIFNQLFEYHKTHYNNELLHSDIMIGAIMSRNFDNVVYCNEILKAIYEKNGNINDLLFSNAISHAVKYNLPNVTSYLINESYQIMGEALEYACMFNSVESLEIILSKLTDTKLTDSNKPDTTIKTINLITPEILNVAIAYDNDKCLKLLISELKNFREATYISLDKSNIICCFENDSHKCLTYICTLNCDDLLSETLKEIDHKIFTKAIKNYLITNNLIVS